MGLTWSESESGAFYIRYTGIHLVAKRSKKGTSGVWAAFLSKKPEVAIGGWHVTHNLEEAKAEAEYFALRRYPHLVELPDGEEAPAVDCQQCFMLTRAEGIPRRCKACAMAILRKLEISGMNVASRRPQPKEAVGAGR